MICFKITSDVIKVDTLLDFPQEMYCGMKCMELLRTETECL